jgi:hypothetical protein
MKIASSNVQLASQHAAVEENKLRESLRAWSGSQRPDFEGRNSAARLPRTDSVSISQQGMAAQQAAPASDTQDAVENDPRMQLIIGLVEALTGKKIKLTSMSNIGSGGATPQVLDPKQAAHSPEAQASAGFGVEYDRHESHYEAEQTNFAAQGVVKTTDGKEIAFNLQLSMSREYFQQSDVSVRLGDAARQAKDPLVINFNGSAAQLTSTKFAFDIDNDGTTENVSFVAPDSGFLALDKNNDGKINNGGELFGPTSGNGFNELAAYDQDGNHWIDENDAVFQQLKVWSKDAQGKDHLATLKEAGVGALYLGNVSTEFSLKDTANNLDGQVRSSSVYLGENGGIGSIQQIDLAV